MAFYENCQFTERSVQTYRVFYVYGAPGIAPTQQLHLVLLVTCEGEGDSNFTDNIICSCIHIVWQFTVPVLIPEVAVGGVPYLLLL
jgi:hypothetical protein